MAFGQALVAEPTFYLWGSILTVAIPLLVLLLGELLERLRRRASRFYRPVRNFRNLLLPQLSFHLIVRFVLALDSASLFMRIGETLLWLTVLYSVLDLLGVLIGNTRLVGAQALGTAAVPAPPEVQLPRVWSELLRILTVVSVFFYVLGGVWGAPMDQVLAALGVGSIVIGFALQDTLSSLVAGLLLAFEKPMAVGHWVRYGAHEGRIIEMNWRSVRMLTLERDMVVIPNSLLGKEVAVNFTMIDPLHAELIHVSFAYQHQPNQVKRMLLETALATPGVVHQPLPHVRVLGYDYDKFAVNYEIKLYTSDYSRTEFIRDEVFTRIYYAAQRYNFAIPHPTTIFYQRAGADLAPPDAFPALVAQLQTLPYFADLAVTVHQQLAHGAAFQYYGAEERLIEEGMSFKGLYIILEGTVQLTLRSGNGAEHEVARLRVGDFFGETLLLRGRASPFGVVVIEDMKTLFIERNTLISVVANNARLSAEMNRFIEARTKLIQRAPGAPLETAGGKLVEPPPSPSRNSIGTPNRPGE